ncbi:DUF1801 domain-containing protein [Aliiglaciecola lipolytica]|uniref:YdhG-like domain-containing protein n=1 Tax=Aliiglaciecola lipolytica E3 TaxID=1127673 RepID=K6YYC8_9ALTE|nr:DUF1801 domain-containing protein [Aliiglaciecola lipolytica]GAC16230.1 hypothetical protein GLIP_3619 [Aliiglaciecola lipolytica E3]
MVFQANPNVIEHIKQCPDIAQEALLCLRELLLNVANNTPEIKHLEETFKWGEPSYITKTGSTLRMDWKPSKPAHISVFVNCQTKLIETFKELYPQELSYVGNREIALPLNKPLPLQVLAHCFELTFKYQKIKHLPLLGC